MSYKYEFYELVKNDKVYLIIRKNNNEICHIDFSLTQPEPDKYLEENETEEFVFWGEL
mgnify:CR=1 FL=1